MKKALSLFRPLHKGSFLGPPFDCKTLRIAPENLRRFANKYTLHPFVPKYTAQVALKSLRDKRRKVAKQRMKH